MNGVIDATEDKVRFVRWVFVTFLAALAAGPVSAADAPDIRKSAEAFYAAYRKTQPVGVPAGKNLALYRPVVSSRLFTLLQRTRAAEVEYGKKNPDSPPMVEGDLFTSLFEGASRYRVEDCQSGERTATCQVELTYVDSRDRKAQRWRDKLFLVKEARGWRVNDIEYGGTWEFMHRGRLQELLESVIKDSQKP